METMLPFLCSTITAVDLDILYVLISNRQGELCAAANCYSIIFYGGAIVLLCCVIAGVTNNNKRNEPSTQKINPNAVFRRHSDVTTL